MLLTLRLNCTCRRATAGFSNHDLAALLADPMKRELLSSNFLLTYLHTLIRAPFELLSDYCEDYDKVAPGRSRLNE
jgi:hypothetical protein